MENDLAKGLIVKALGGFYYVNIGNEIIECRARGAFRKEDISPYVGDTVTIELTEQNKGYIMEIGERKNSLIRPPVANIDRLAMVVSSTAPRPNTLVIDKLTAIACRRDIPVVIIFTKIDMSDPVDVNDIYRKAGFTVFNVNNMTGEGCEAVKKELSSGITAFCGNSGVGKSSLLNALFGELKLATADISKKLGRGKHTTRHVELYKTDDGGYIADTPGFSAVDFLQFEKMTASALEDCFVDFQPYLGECRYTGCSHVAERDCAIRTAVADGEISESRYRSYCTIYEELKQVKQWEL